MRLKTREFWPAGAEGPGRWPPAAGTCARASSPCTHPLTLPAPTVCLLSANNLSHSFLTAVFALLLAAAMVLPQAECGRAGLWEAIADIPGAINEELKNPAGYTLLMSEAQHLIMQGVESFQRWLLARKANGLSIHVGAHVGQLGWPLLCPCQPFVACPPCQKPTHFPPTHSRLQVIKEGPSPDWKQPTATSANRNPFGSAIRGATSQGMTAFYDTHGISHERAHAEADFAQTVFMAAATGCAGTAGSSQRLLLIRQLPTSPVTSCPLIPAVPAPLPAHPCRDNQIIVLDQDSDVLLSALLARLLTGGFIRFWRLRRGESR